MERVSPGDILSGTFEFIGSHRKAIAIWSAVYLATIVALRLAMRGITPVPPAGPPTIQLVLLFLAVYVAMIAVVIALNTAIFRAALDPEQQDKSYLRFGMDELRLIGLLLLLLILFFIGMIGVTIVLGIFSVGLVALGVVGLMLNIVLSVAIWIAMIAAMVFFVVRLASAGPLTVLRKKITLGEAWRLTRGRFWALFGAYAVVAIIWLVVMMTLFTVSFGPMQQAIFAQMRHTGDPAYQSRMMVEQLQQMFSFGPFQIVMLVIGAVAYMVLIALQCGSVAIATKLLLNEQQPASVF